MSQNAITRLLGGVRRLASTARIAVARGAGAQIGRGCMIGPRCDVHLGIANARRGTIELADDCELVADVTLHPYGGCIRLEPRIHVGPGCILYGHGGIAIGADTLLGPHCRIFSSEHDVQSLSHPIRSLPDLLRPVRIGRDVWLGAGVTVLGGVTIGDGCVVGAGSVVTRDLPAGSICHGTPARIKGWRAGATTK